MRTRITVAALFALVAALAMSLGGRLLSAQTVLCDFVTGGGWILPQAYLGGKGTFGVGGGCKNGSFWGHLEYQDHGMSKKIHWTAITGYDKTPDNARLICGTGRTPSDNNVKFVVRVKDAVQPDEYDQFDIQWDGTIDNYTTFGPPGTPFHNLVGGNILLHKPNKSNTGSFGGCTLPTPNSGNVTLRVTLQSSTDASSGESTGSGGTVISDANAQGTAIGCTLAPGTPANPSPTQTNTPACEASFAAGATVTLTAQGAGSSASFSGNCVPTTPSVEGLPRCQVTLAGNSTEVTITFAPAE